MAILLALLRPLQAVLDVVLRLGRGFATLAIGLMVVCILLQVFMRYVLNNALPWPEEAARFLMLWMTGLIAPSAYRRGGFVAIDMIQAVLPRTVGALLTIALLGVSLLVLIVAIQLGHKHVFGSCLFKSSTLWLPFTLKFSVPIPLTGLDLTVCTKESPAFGFAWGWTKMPLSLSFLSLWVGVVLLTVVNVELILRAMVGLLGGEDRLRPQMDADLTVE
ncbi:TRAP transporter small permease [Thetidibacter halocola]|uniref:TRAP transporter small permease protein n=1 Tax=Thetidibacter halocola TaxID=2827239 RepID=A0A8J7WIA3_9RHOB|nr:TRAP transporter small permease subunit [Thetidibacter halocola]MBS0125608.1 TRAP transporter small permease subunit [Thetidibacter halocola]